MPPREFATFTEFWTYYVGEHTHVGNRALHYIGFVAALACLVTAGVTQTWLPLACAPLAGYAFAWMGHALIEGNRPATWGWPAWSLVAEIKMVGLAGLGRMRAEVERVRRQTARVRRARA
jgi:hypothetical protein